MRRLVVVGNGMAGARVLEELLARGGGERFAITVVGEEPYGSYNRILLSEVLAAGVDDEIFLNPPDWYPENGITLRAGVRVVRIDRHDRVVLGDDGSVIPYDTLVLATGSRSFFPPMSGLWASATELTRGVFGFRSLDDATGMLAHVRDVRTAVVVGGGLLGLEAAAGLQEHGVAVHVAHPTEVLMNQQLETEAAAVLRGTLEGRGLHLHLGVKAHEIVTSDGGVSGVRFTDGSALACDMVVVTAGVRPNIGLAAAAGLTTQHAIVVDDRMRSEHVHAVGECAQHRGEVYGVVAPLWEQAAVLADVLTGTDASYQGSRLATKLKVAGVEVAQMGVKGPEHETDELVRFSRRGVHQSVVIRDGTLVGATLVGDVSRVAALTQAFDSGSALPEDRAKLLFDVGSGSSVAAADLPDDARVCQCNRVSKGDLVACVERGAGTPAACMDATRAGTGCGSCRPLVTEIVDAALASGGLVVGGVTTPDHLRLVADVAEKHDVDVMELLGRQEIALLGVPGDRREEVRAALATASLVVRPG
jgi:nitrite reductase (NADH) large subunit